MIGSPVTEVLARTASLTLPRPLVLGDLTVTRREYAGVVVKSEDGTTGVSYCLTREAPMAELIDRLIVPHVMGGNSSDVLGMWDRAFRGSAIVGRVGLVRRALGLVDIALWDVAARRAGIPVWKSAGISGPGPRDAMLVAAYPTEGRSVSSIVDEVLAHAETGWPMVKISRTRDAELMKAAVVTLARELGDRTRLVVDASFGWRNAEEAIGEIRSWGNIELAWVEDPLLPEGIAEYVRLRRAIPHRVGAGDEVTDPALLRALVEAEAIDVLRIDIVAIGGITPALPLIQWAQARGVRVSGHVYPEVTAHLGIDIETFERNLEGNPYDPAPSFVVGGPDFSHGHATAPDGPGLGFGLSTEVFDFEGE